MDFIIIVDNLFIKEGIRSILSSKYIDSEIHILNSITEMQTIEFEPSSIVICNDIDELSNYTELFKSLSRDSNIKFITIANSLQMNQLTSIDIDFIDALIFTNCSLNELNEAMGYIQAGLKYRCKKFTTSNTLISEFDLFLKSKDISFREKEIIEQILLGKTSNEIAETLFISYHTVTTHRKNINKKLNIKSPQDLIRVKMLLNNDSNMSSEE